MTPYPAPFLPFIPFVLFYASNSSIRATKHDSRKQRPQNKKSDSHFSEGICPRFLGSHSLCLVHPSESPSAEILECYIPRGYGITLHDEMSYFEWSHADILRAIFLVVKWTPDCLFLVLNKRGDWALRATFFEKLYFSFFFSEHPSFSFPSFLFL